MCISKMQQPTNPQPSFDILPSQWWVKQTNTFHRYMDEVQRQDRSVYGPTENTQIEIYPLINTLVIADAHPFSLCSPFDEGLNNYSPKKTKTGLKIYYLLYHLYYSIWCIPRVYAYIKYGLGLWGSSNQKVAAKGSLLDYIRTGPSVACFMSVGRDILIHIVIEITHNFRFWDGVDTE